MSAQLEGERKPRTCLRDVIVGVIVLLFLAALLIPAVNNAREAARMATCVGNLKGFGLAMANYEATNRRFPPAYLVDPDGRPTHSWRVLLLPYMEAQAFYERYSFKLPWYSAHNRALAAGLPMGMGGHFPVYHCNADLQTDPLDISYAMIVGNEAFSPGPIGRTLNDIADGTSNTIWLGDFAESGIPWLEPRDLQFDGMSFKINDFDHPSLRSKHRGKVSVIFLDGSVHTWKEDVDEQVVRALMSVAGGEQLQHPDR